MRSFGITIRINHLNQTTEVDDWIEHQIRIKFKRLENNAEVDTRSNAEERNLERPMDLDARIISVKDVQNCMETSFSSQLLGKLKLFTKRSILSRNTTLNTVHAFTNNPHHVLQIFRPYCLYHFKQLSRLNFPELLFLLDFLFYNNDYIVLTLHYLFPKQSGLPSAEKKI